MLLRCEAGLALIRLAWITLVPSPRFQALVASVAIAAGLLLLAGLFTPMAGSIGAAATLGMALSAPDDLAAHILLGGVCGAIVMTGPGAWSIDARLFGRTRLDFRDPYG
jgi:putative oxidoreductase